MTTVLEKIGSRPTEFSKSGGSVKLEVFITGSDSESVVFARLQSWAPTVYSGLVLEKLAINQDAPGVWTGEATYGRPEDQEPEKPNFGEFTFSFETGGGKQRIMAVASEKTKPYAPPGGVHPDFGGAINVGDDLKVEGVEIVVPQLTFEVSTKIQGGSLSPSYARTLAGLTGNVNSRKFLDCDAGTLLFEGASGSYKVGENIDRELKFKFAYSPNKVNFKVGEITIDSKKGWQYLSVHFRKKVDPTSACIVMQPYSAYVHTIYEEADFRRYLGFG